MSKDRLVADVGGTNVRFACARTGGGASLDEMRAYPACQFAEFGQALDAYLADVKGRVQWGEAAIAAAGPVDDGVVQLTNLDWRIDARQVSQRLGGVPARVVNDLEAVALFLPAAGSQDARALGPQALPSARRAAAMLAVNMGTGFGAAAVRPDGRGGWVTVPGEPGHTTLPRCRAARLADTLGIRSVEEVLSGSGVAAAYQALALAAGEKSAQGETVALERFPPDPGHCDEGHSGRGQEGGAGRSGATHKPPDAATARMDPSLRGARPRTPVSLRSSTDAPASPLRPRLPVVSRPGDAAGPDQVGSALDAREVFLRAATGHDPIARALVDDLSELIGSVAGDLALITGAWDGVFLCGSVAEGWASVGDMGRFRSAFEDKGPMARRMARVFTGLLTRPNVALCGLARLDLA